MIVDLDVLKRALGIPEDDTSSDAALTELEVRISTWIEGQTKRKFSAPSDVTEFIQGKGTAKLFLAGHLDGDVTSDDVAVRVRSTWPSFGDWEDFTDFELRGDALLRTDGSWWGPNEEYEVKYDSGYASAPEDVQQLVIEMVGNEWDAQSGDATGISSEHIGDYSYTLDSGAVLARGSLTSTGWATLNRWKRLLV